MAAMTSPYTTFDPLLGEELAGQMLRRIEGPVDHAGAAPVASRLWRTTKLIEKIHRFSARADRDRC